MTLNGNPTGIQRDLSQPNPYTIPASLKEAASIQRLFLISCNARQILMKLHAYKVIIIGRVLGSLSEFDERGCKFKLESLNSAYE